MISLSIDGSLLVQLANFILLILVLNFLLYRPIRRILADREELFTRLKEKAEKASIALESGDAEKVRLNTESVRQAMAIKNELTQKGQQQEKNILVEAQEQAARQVSEGRVRLSHATELARATLSTETQGIANNIAEKILGRAV